MLGVTTRQPGKITVYNVMDPKYGAVADAVEATSCAANEDIPMNCSSEGSGTNDSSAINAAIAAACATTPVGGEIRIPGGKYRIGEAGGDYYDDAIQVTCDNITLRGDGVGRTVLLPGNSANGIAVIVACSNPGSDCVAATEQNGLVIRDLTIRDDDPYRHQCYEGGVVEVSGYAGGPFLFNEELTFDNSSATGNFFWLNSGEDVFIYGDVSGTPNVDDTITGELSGASVDIDTIRTANGSANSTGILLRNQRNFLIENVRIEYIGLDGISVDEATDGVIRGNYFYEVPGCIGNGDAVGITDGTSILVTENHCQLGSGGGSRRTGCYSVKQGCTGVIVANNVAIEDDRFAGDHNEGQLGIAVTTTGDPIDQIAVLGNRVSVGPDQMGTCEDAPSTFCNADATCGTYCENYGRNFAGHRVGAIVAHDSNTNIGEVVFANNIVTGRIHGEIAGSSSKMTIIDNVVTGTDDGAGLQVSAVDTIKIESNIISGFNSNCITVVATLASAELLIRGNTCFETTGNPGQNTSAVIVNSSSAIARGLIAQNDIIGTGDVSGFSIEGIDCNGSAVNVVGNRIYNMDRFGIEWCVQEISHNYVDTTGGHAIRSLASNGALIANNTVVNGGSDGIVIGSGSKHATVRGNVIYGSTSEGIIIDDSLYTTASGNTCYNVGGGECIDVTGDSAFTRCFSNVSWGEDDADYIITEHTGLAGGTPAIGDRVVWNTTEHGYVVAYSAAGNGAITIIPDSVAADQIASGVDNVTEDPPGWTTTATVVTQTASAAPVIDCLLGGGVEFDSVEIPAP
jgi:parallel beta-helix repeat protein